MRNVLRPAALLLILFMTSVLLTVYPPTLYGADGNGGETHRWASDGPYGPNGPYGPTTDFFRFNGIAGVDANNAWVIGDNGYVALYDGVTFREYDSGTSETLRCVESIDRDHVWAVGANGTIVFFDGTAWHRQCVNTEKTLVSVSAFDPNNVWTLTSEGDVYYFNGNQWTLLFCFPQGRGKRNIYSGLEVLDASHIWACGCNPQLTSRGTTYDLIMFYSGTEVIEQWRGHYGDTTVEAISAADANHVWASIGDGIFFYDGLEWNWQYSTDSTIHDVDAISASCVWAVGEEGLYYFNGSNWCRQTDLGGGYSSRSFISAVSSRCVWSLYGCGVYSFNGNNWILRCHEKRFKSTAISTYGADNFWVYGTEIYFDRKNMFFHYDGTNWSSGFHHFPYTLRDFEALDDSRLWACTTDYESSWGGTIGRLISFDGPEWSVIAEIPRFDFTSITVLDPHNIWAVGEYKTADYKGAICHYDGSNWTIHITDCERLYDIFALDEEHMWAVGSEGTILLFDGESWTKQESGTNITLRGVAACDPSHVWAVGCSSEDGEASPKIYYFDGSKWQSEYIGLNKDLYGVCATDPTHVWAVGEDATIVFFDGRNWWSECVPTNNSMRHISAADPDHVWAIGSYDVFLGQPDRPYVYDRVCAHDSIGTSEPNTTWYLAEGSTGPGFETWVLVQNPGNTPADVQLTYQTDQGEMGGPALTIPSKSRVSVNVSDSVQSYEVSTTVTANKPVVAERALYFGDRGCAHDSIGVTEPGTTWYLAEGATSGGFETWILVQNPGAETTHVSLEYMTGKGQVEGPEFDLAPGSRESIAVADTVETYEVSTKIVADKPVIAERAMYFEERKCAHGSIGAKEQSNTWYLAEGCTFGGFETWVLVQNPGGKLAEVSLTYQTAQGEVAGPTVQVGPRTRETINVANTVETYEVSTKVDSDRPVIAERAVYYGDRGCAHDSIGVTEPRTSWYLAEGASNDGFDTWILVQNPGAETAHVNLEYMTGNGEVKGPEFDLSPGSRKSVSISDTVRTYNVSTHVTSDKPVVAERAVYYLKRVFLR